MPTEQQLRYELAAAYRLSAYFDWMDTVFNHISVRLPKVEGEKESYLVNPEGYLSEEITPDKLVKIDVEGNILDQPEASVIPAGFTIHSALHLARENAVCIMHNHSMPGMIVSAMKDNTILPVTQITMEFYNRVAYHDFGGIALDLDDRERIVRDMGELNCMIMRNHGLLTVGKSVAEAFYFMYYLNKACEVMIQVKSAVADPLIPTHEICEHTARQYEPFHERDVDMLWKAMLRKLDRMFPGWEKGA